jgi:hypothetical protein
MSRNEPSSTGAAEGTLEQETHGETNVNKVDRALRVVAGGAILSVVPFPEPALGVLAALSLVVSGLIGFCPVYGLLGLWTGRTKR